MRLKINKNEVYAAGLMMLIGLGTVLGSLNYEVRTLARMGPGYFPLLLGSMLILISTLILASPAPEDGEVSTTKLAPQFRAWTFVVVGVVLFIVLGKYGGLVPATFMLVFVSALGDRSNSLKAAAGLSAVITLMAVGIFHYGLQMQFRLFTWG
ncbi:MAG: tripartite tricarboxylate transporter TctB family protein [Castellaniella sp.]